MTDETIDAFLAHYGTPRKSGRYPWGSGENPGQRHRDFLGKVDELKRQGLTEKQIADGLNISTTDLRAAKSIAKTAERQANIAMAQRMKDKGMSNIAIGERMGLNESSVRALLAPGAQDKSSRLDNITDMLKKDVEENGYIDVGVGVERYMGISDTMLKTSVARMEQEGYKLQYIPVDQLGTGKKTTVKVLTKDDVPYREVFENPDRIKSPRAYSDDDGHSFDRIVPPVQIDSKRLAIRYAEDGGTDADGVMYIRPGVDDIALGGKRYAQVRLAVDGTHYVKGMAIYKDDLPDGVDILFNTNKSNTGNKMDALKPQKNDPDDPNPFGSVIRQRRYLDANGKEQLSAMNIVNEEGSWDQWSKSISSQVLSKQSPSLAREQLGLAFMRKQAAFDEINSLTNPAVKKRLMDGLADDLDASSVYLKAAAMPRQRSQVILPINSLKDTEVYAPNFRNGEKVVLVRHPHGGKFEIPELVVNNNHPDAKKMLGQAIDGIGINSNVAARLSGADFDGDTVLVIPNNSNKFKSESALKGLKGFEPSSYKNVPGGEKRISPKLMQTKMGDISNLITDMTIRGASHDELARAVRHSMVVIDSYKHNLNHKQSAKDNGIAALKQKYQGSSKSGATTLISRSKGRIDVPERKDRRASQGGPVDPKTGKKVYELTGKPYTNKKGELVMPTMISKKMLETDDARTLSSGTPIESIYADHANKLKALANRSRKESLQIKSTPYSPSAKTAYSNEVASLNSKLNVALKNAPLERQAQLIANTRYKAKLDANPSMGSDEKKKEKGLALQDARAKVGARKKQVVPTDREWEAIQAGAISNNKLKQILDNSDIDAIKKLALPKNNMGMSNANKARASSMLNAGYTKAEIADAIGVSVSTLNKELGGE